MLTDAAVRNAMVLHAAFGGSTNLLLHLPAIAFSAGLKRPTRKDWEEVNREVPRLVDALPNGPRGFATVQVFLAGGVPEVMLELRAAGLLDTSVKTVSGDTLDASLDWWRDSERRHTLRGRLKELDGIDPDDVIMTPDRARARGLTATVCFPVGNLAPEGSVIKSTAIDASLIGVDNVYRHRGPARVFTTEAAAIAAIKAGKIGHGDVIVLICSGPKGAGMQEIYQVTSALKAVAALQACGGADGRALQRGFDGRVHRAHFAGGAGGWTDREGARWRSDRNCDRSREVDGIGAPGWRCER